MRVPSYIDGISYRLETVEPIQAIRIDLGDEGLICEIELFDVSGDGSLRKIGDFVVHGEADIPFAGLLQNLVLRPKNEIFPPQVTMLRQKMEVVFNTPQDGKYLLAYGSANVPDASIPIDSIMRKGENVKRAAALSSIMLGNPDALIEHAKREPKSDKTPTMAIWTLLVAGVLFLCYLGWRLARELRAE
jgi:hypothetical protein